MKTTTAAPPAPRPGRQDEARDFTTVSGRPVSPLYTTADVAGVSYDGDVGDPGRFPYTRGIHPAGYGGKLWTMRQFAGYGTPEETNARYRELQAAGGTGLSVAFDLPTLMGRDPDHELSLGEVGKCGVNVASVADMERLFDGIALDRVTTSMTINSPAAMIFAMYLVVAERQGVDWSVLSGTIQKRHPQGVHRPEGVHLPAAAVDAPRDRRLRVLRRPRPAAGTPSRSAATHIREAGCDSAPGAGVHAPATGLNTSSTASTRGCRWTASRRGSPSSSTRTTTSSRRSPSTRAARKLWATVMRERFGAEDERSWKLRFHAQTAGVSLTAQQPYNNVVRTAVQALAAVLGGTNSLHTNSLDEALALPAREAALLALRTQQVIAHESGVPAVTDPFGGSYFLERLTRDLEVEALESFEKIDRLGGMVAAIEQGYPQREIANSAYQFQQALDQGTKTCVGVNRYVTDAETPIETLYIDEAAAERQVNRVRALRLERDAARVSTVLGGLRRAAEGTENLMPRLLDAARAGATLGEMCDALRDVWGEYEETAAL